MQKPKYVSGKRWLPGKQIEIKSAGQVKCNPNSFQAPSSLHHLLSIFFTLFLISPICSGPIFCCLVHCIYGEIHQLRHLSKIKSASVQFFMIITSSWWAAWVDFLLYENCKCVSLSALDVFPASIMCLGELRRPRALIGRKDAHWRVVKSFGNHLAFKMMWVVNAVQLLC